MAHDDRFFTLVCCAALIITGVVFLWTHNGLISLDLAGATDAISEIEPVEPAPPEIRPGTLPVTNAESDDAPAAVHAVSAEHIGVKTAPSETTGVATFPPDQVLGVLEAIGQRRIPQIAGWDLPSSQEVLVRRDHNGRMVVAPGTHRRYDKARDAIAGLNGPTVAAACDVLEHSLANGLPGEGVMREKVLEALDVLLAPELPDVELDMVSRGTHWGFADPGLDDLAPVQQHMLLMGIDNQRAVRTALQDIRRYLGGSAVTVPATDVADPAPEILVARTDAPGDPDRDLTEATSQDLILVATP